MAESPAREAPPAPLPLSYDQWAAHGTRYGELLRTLNWQIAAWMLAGERLYGEQAAHAFDATGLAPQQLLHLLAVWQAVPEERRHPALSFSHHEAVHRLGAEEQEIWLARAEAGDPGAGKSWSVTRLRQAIRQGYQGGTR